MEKSPDAFRTISEVAEWLDVPTHVLRFWESRFSQVKPVKRAGGRRYYRPADMRLIGGIKKLLHDDGMTIRGVQKLLREEGVKHVAGFSQPLEHEEDRAIEIEATAEAVITATEPAAPELAFLPRGEAQEPEPEPVEVLRAEEKPRAVADDAPLPPGEPDFPSARPDSPDTPQEEPAPERASEAIPPAPNDAQVVAFGSVRASRDREDELPLGMPSAGEPEQVSGPENLIDEESLAPDVSDTPEPASEPAAPTPIVADAPDTDPEDDAEDYAGEPSLTARLLMFNPAGLRDDVIRIEQVVAALRAVRDRSAS